MAYIFGLVVVALFFLSMHYFTELDKKQKTIITIVILVIILSAIAFNKYSSTQRDKMMSIVNSYNQGNTIECNGVSINSKEYDLSTGTYTFIGRKNTPNSGQMISASSCE